MRTHHGNVGAVIADIGATTIESLRRYGIPYHELCFGKPYAQFYIDDLAVSATPGCRGGDGVHGINCCHGLLLTHSVLLNPLGVAGSQCVHTVLDVCFVIFLSPLPNCDTAGIHPSR